MQTFCILNNLEMISIKGRHFVIKAGNYFHRMKIFWIWARGSGYKILTFCILTRESFYRIQILVSVVRKAYCIATVDSMYKQWTYHVFETVLVKCKHTCFFEREFSYSVDILHFKSWQILWDKAISKLKEKIVTYLCSPLYSLLSKTKYF